MTPGSTDNNAGVIQDEIEATDFGGGDDSIAVTVAPPFPCDDVDCSSGLGTLKVTLVWDDMPATPNAAKTLINDLDLEVVAPDGTRYFPWVLNPEMPAAAATRAPDHLNNVEQVTVGVANPGIWTIKVKRFVIMEGGIEEGPIEGMPVQRYSLVFQILEPRP